MAERHRERRPRRRREEFSDESEAAREQRDQDFITDVETRLRDFIESEEQSLPMDPMNSYNRRLVHTIAKTYQLDTESHGEDRERYVLLIKTSDTRIPKDAKAQTAKAAAAMKAESDRAPRERAPSRDRGGPSARPSNDRAPSERSSSDRAPRSAGRSGGGRPWDHGSQQFPVKAGSHIALKADGSVELYRESEAPYIVADKVVRGSTFRVRNGQIVEPGEEGY